MPHGIDVQRRKEEDSYLGEPVHHKWSRLRESPSKDYSP